MTFLTLNSITIPVAPGSGARRAANLGAYGRSHGGTPYSTVHARKVDMLAKTAPQTEATAEAFEGLFQGLGMSWNFNTPGVAGLTSSTGLLAGSTAGTVTPNSAPSKFGPGALYLATDSFISWVVGEDAEWTMLMWRIDGAYAHYAFTSTGLIYKNGVVGATDPISFSVSGPELMIDTTGRDEELVDDLVYLPYIVPAEWMTQFTASTTAWGPLPRHAVGGTWLERRCSTALTQWVATDPVNGYGGTVGAEVSFELYGA